MKRLNGVMSNHKLIISSAGSGKTTFLVRNALENTEQQILITTYTENNEREIRNKFIQEIGYVPRNVIIQTWFSFLIQHGVKPYQGLMNTYLFNKDVNGMLLVSKQSGFRFTTKKGFPVYFGEEDDFERHYFSKGHRIYSDKLSKFIYKLSSIDNGLTFDRISQIFDHIMIDEVQDLAGHDLELIKIMMKNCAQITMVGDPRQVTYLTHLEAKNKKYRNGNIVDYLVHNCKTLIKDGIDETTLIDSHRCTFDICNLSSKLYPNLPATTSCGCCNVVPDEHEGVFLIKPEKVDEYLEKFDATQLRWNKAVKTNPNYNSKNFGESKGATYDRVLIYPTEKMKIWIEDNTKELTNETRAKFYVGLTRARFSATIVLEYENKKDYPDLIKYQFE